MNIGKLSPDAPLPSELGTPTVIEPQSLPGPVVNSRYGPLLYLIGIVFLGLIGLVAVVGSLVLAYAGKTVDGAAIAIGAGAVSALALMIAPGTKAG
jgi:hypothetical protein